MWGWIALAAGAVAAVVATILIGHPELAATFKVRPAHTAWVAAQ